MESFNDDNPNIPDSYKNNDSIVTCHNIYNLQNKIKTTNIIKNIIGSEKLFISLDTESYERNHNLLTEIGWVIFDKLGKIKKKRQCVIKENIKYHNKRVGDNKFNYNFGRYEVIPLTGAKKILINDLKKVDYIVGQDIKKDTRDLEKIGIDLTKFEVINGVEKPYGIIDTLDLYTGNFIEKGIKLEKGLEKLSISYENLHNAGNDAYYTMQYFLKLIELFNISNTKIQDIMTIKIPDGFTEEFYKNYREEKKQRKKQENEQKKLNQN